MYYVGSEFTGGSICLESGIVCSEYSVLGFVINWRGFIKRWLIIEKKILHKNSERTKKCKKIVELLIKFLINEVCLNILGNEEWWTSPGGWWRGWRLQEHCVTPAQNVNQRPLQRSNGSDCYKDLSGGPQQLG